MQSLVSPAAMNILSSSVHSPPHIFSKGQDYNLNNSAWKNISKRMPRANDISMQRTYLINGACEQSDALVPIEALIKRLNNAIASYKTAWHVTRWVGSHFHTHDKKHRRHLNTAGRVLIMTDFTVILRSINYFAL